MKNIRNVLIILILLITTQLSVFAYGNQKLFMKSNYTYLLNFDEKVEKISVGNDNFLYTELVSSIFNDKQQLILKPIKGQDTNVIVWTKKGLYNFDIYVDKSDKQTAKIIDLNSGDAETLDKPPMIVTQEVFNIELDAPPSIKSKEKKDKN